MIFDRWFGRLVRRETSNPEKRMTFGEHLNELRMCLIKSLLAIGVALLLCLIKMYTLVGVMTAPHFTAQNMLWNKQIEEIDGLTDRQQRELEADPPYNSLDVWNARVDALQAFTDDQKGRLRRISFDPKEFKGAIDAEKDMDDLTRKRLKEYLPHSGEEWNARLQEVQKMEDVKAKLKAKPPRRVLFLPDDYTGPFFSYCKLAFIASLFLASPVVAYQIWLFVGAGLYPHEKRWILLFAPFSFLLFAAGCLFGYFILIPNGLMWLAWFSDPDMVQQYFTISKYLDLVLLLTIVTGVLFQIPILMMFFALIGLVGWRQYLKFWRWAILLAFIVAAVVTPSPDMVTQSLLAIPMLVLYFGGVGLSAFVSRPKKKTPEPPPPDARGDKPPPPPPSGDGSSPKSPEPSASEPSVSEDRPSAPEPRVSEEKPASAAADNPSPESVSEDRPAETKKEGPPPGVSRKVL